MAVNYEEIRKRAKDIRIDVIKSIYQAGSGHPGGSLSAADMMAVLFFHELNLDPHNPKMIHRDKFVLSKGHAAPVLYATLAERGFFPKEELMSLRKFGSNLQGHPDMRKVPGVEMSTGSLGQGISAAVGMALAAKLDNNPGRVYVMLGDGEIQEGMVWEAMMAAAHYNLDNLIVLLDWNGIQIDGWNDEVMCITPVEEKMKSFCWETIVIDGHDVKDIVKALEKARNCKGKPCAIIAKTKKGKGVSFMEDNNGWHGKAPNEEQAKQAVAELGGDWS
ncbi:MAG: transketolase [Eubacteriales bacterium]|nr:transketolase [Eubacteriales bacterium]MDD4584045.1 transketolase [Eubacteriales bacterium]